MKRITAYLKGKIENIKCASREKRVYSAIDAANINFEEQIADADTRIDKLLEEISTTDNVLSVIQEISDCMDDKEEAQRGIKRLQDIRKYLDEEIEAEEDEK